MRIDVEKEVSALRAMTAGQLCQRYAELFGELSRTRHKAYLIRKIAWRLQAIAEGDLSERARRRAEELANDAEVRVTPPRGFDARLQPGGDSATQAIVATDPDRRLPAPGTAIVRQYKGQTLRVLVLPDGLEFDGNRYKSLTAVAKAIAAAGDSQYTEIVLRRATTNETPAELTIDGAAPTGTTENTSNRFICATGKTYACLVMIAARQSDGTSAFFLRQVVVKNVSGTVSLEGSVQTVGVDINPAGWTVPAITADNTNKSLVITVTGVAATNIRWSATIQAQEIIY